MEIGIFGSPGADMFGGGIAFGAIGTLLLVIGLVMAVSGKSSGEQSAGGIVGAVALCFLLTSIVLVSIGNGSYRVGECFDRLPAATFAVDGAFALNEEVLYVVIQGKNDDDKIVRKCATLSIGTVKDYPNRPIEPGEYWIVVEDHNSADVEWTTNTFVPADQK